MTKKSTEELITEREALKKRLTAIRELEEVKKERDQLEKEVKVLHRSVSLKWKLLRKAGSLGKKYGKEVGKWAVEETRDLINGDDEEKEEDKGEALL
jgi:hypothetical protein